MSVFSPGRDKLFYRIVLALSFLLSVIWVLAVDTIPVSDFNYYHELAQQIAQGGQWGDTYTTVGYPIVLGFLYKLFGANWYVAEVLNIMLTLANNLLLFKILDQSRLREGVRRAVFVLFALFPAVIYYNSLVATEIMFTTVLLLTTVVYLSSIRYKYLLLGVLTAVNTMIKPFFILYFLVIFLTELLARPDDRRSFSGTFVRALTRAGIILVVSMIVLSPWLYRNYRLNGEFTWVSNNGGIVLYINNNSQNIHGGWMPADQVENSLVTTPEYLVATGTEKNKMLSRAAKEWIVSHPREFIELGMKRLVLTFKGEGDDLYFAFNGSSVSPEWQAKIYQLNEIVRIPVFMLGVFSILVHSLLLLFKLFKNEKISSFESYLLILFYMFAGTYFLTEGQSRYAFPTLWILIYFFWQVPKLFKLTRLPQ